MAIVQTAAAASAHVEVLAPPVVPPTFHPSLGLPEDRLVYRPCPLFPFSPPKETHLANASTDSTSSYSVRIPPASVPLIFAHRQWRAGLILADLLAAGIGSHSPWDVHNLTVAELGCGTGLPGMVASRLGGAASVLITDYDAPPLIQTLQSNLTSNFQPDEVKKRIRAMGYTWGTNIEDLQDTLDTMRRERRRSGLAESPALSNGTFDRILLADCVWDSLSHELLLGSLSQLLAKPARSSNMQGAGLPPMILLVSGFHTGRDTLVSFLRRAHRFGLVLRSDLGELLPSLMLEEEDVATEEQQRLGQDATEHPLWNAPRFVCELELADDVQVQEPTSRDASMIIDAGNAPRMTGRRRAFVLEEREEERKEKGGVHIRNRWMTIFALGWAA